MKRSVLPILTSCVLLLCSCAKKTEEPEIAIEPAPPFEALGEVSEGQKDIYVIVKNLNSNYWQVIIDGAEAAGKDFGCNIYCSGSYAETDWESQQRLLDEAMEAGADAVVFAPNDSVKLSEKLEEIYNSGIPVVLIDTIANTDSYDICYMTDNLLAGQQAAEEMLKLLKDAGNDTSKPLEIGIQVGALNSQTINERLAGFSQYWSSYAPEGWEMISDIKCNEGNADQAIECARDMLKEHPDIKGVFGSNNGSTVGFAKIVKELGRTDITVVGFDYSEEIAELINSDEYNAATMLQRQYDMSYTGVKTSLELIDGGSVSVKFVDTGVTAVDKDSLKDPETQEILTHN